MKILDIYAKGYAGATMDGTSFMVKRFSLATKLISKKDGDISLWGEEEINMIQKWMDEKNRRTSNRY